MKRIFWSLVLVGFMVTMTAGAVLAGGDKVRGDEGQGDVNQWGPTPFGEDTPPVQP